MPDSTAKLSPEGSGGPGCPPQSRLLAFLRGQLPLLELKEISTHVTYCLPCQTWIAEQEKMLADDGESAGEKPPTGPPAREGKAAGWWIGGLLIALILIITVWWLIRHGLRAP